MHVTDPPGPTLTQATPETVVVRLDDPHFPQARVWRARLDDGEVVLLYVAAVVPLATTRPRAIADALETLPAISLYVSSAEAAAFAFGRRSEAARQILADEALA